MLIDKEKKYEKLQLIKWKKLLNPQGTHSST